MDTVLDVMELIVFLAAFLLSFLIIILLRRKRRNVGNYRLPPSLPSLPLVGSLPFLRKFDHLAKFFLKKSKQLGPIFTMNIGRKLCLILNDRELMTEALVRNNLVFAGKEGIVFEDHGVNPKRKGIAFHNFDSDFKKYHKLSLSILKEFGFGDKQLMESRILTEVEALVAFIRSKRNKAFNPNEVTSQATSNIILNIVLGFREEYQNGIHEIALLIQKATDALDPLLVVAPFLRFIPYLNRSFHFHCKTSERVLQCIEFQIEKIKTEDNTVSFVKKYLEKEGSNYDHEQLLFTVRDFIGAGATTTATVLRWSMIFLSNYPEVQNRVFEEIEANVPRSRLPTLQDRSKMPYSEATILEIMRIRTIGPLALPHLTLNDAEVGGYFIPTGTTVLTNLYAVHMDPEVWNDPETFRPERFLDERNNVVGREKMIPFSIGRRSCIGEELARQEVFLFLTGLIQNFIILHPPNQKWIDDKEVCGTVVEPKPFDIRMISRDT